MNTITTGFALTLLAATAALAQQPAAFTPAPNPTPGCTATPAQLEANKKVVAEGLNIDRIDPSYKQHNPAFVKRARDKGITDYEEFKSAFGGRGGGRGPGRGAAKGPQPPAGNGREIVVAECDLVVTIHKQYRQDPTAAPGTWYEAFTFDVFRVKDGKMVEHWDNALINEPAPGAAPAPAPGR